MENLETRARAQCRVDLAAKRRFASEDERERAVDRYWPAVAAEIVGDVAALHGLAPPVNIGQLSEEYRSLRAER